MFVHVFSGYRRETDFHALEHQVWGEIRFFVLFIGMCRQEIEGNLGTSDAFRFWMIQIDSGQVCGMGGEKCINVDSEI